jgi:hypothetical protein
VPGNGKYRYEDDREHSPGPSSRHGCGVQRLGGVSGRPEAQWECCVDAAPEQIATLLEIDLN